MTRTPLPRLALLLALWPAAAGAAISGEELVTVGTEVAAWTWVTDGPAESCVVWGTTEHELHAQHCEDGPDTRFHYLELEGLEPATTYYYATVSGLDVGVPNEHSPGSFTTLARPAGDLLFRFATINDLHVGEAVAGLGPGYDDPEEDGFSWPDPDNPYWRFTNRAVVEELNQRGVARVFVKGDITADAELEECEAAHDILDELEMPWHPLRGNHDRIAADGVDHFLAVFGERMGDGVTWYAVDHGDWRFLLLDSADPEDGWPAIAEPQWAFLEAELSAERRGRLVLMLHHAVTEEATVVFSLLPEDRDHLLDLLRDRDDLVMVLSGHSHRAKVTHAGAVPGVPFVETVSTKEYPGSYVLYDVYEEGVVQTTWRARCPECLEWYELTKGEYGGHAYDWQFGEPADRHFSLALDPLPPAAGGDDGGCGGCATSPRPIRASLLGLAAGVILALIVRRRFV